MRKSLCRILEAQTTSTRSYRRETFSVYVRGLREAIFSRLQPSHSRSNSHGRSPLRLPLRRMLKEICSEHQFKKSHPHPRQGQPYFGSQGGCCPVDLGPASLGSGRRDDDHFGNSLGRSAFRSRFILGTQLIVVTLMIVVCFEFLTLQSHLVRCSFFFLIYFLPCLFSYFLPHPPTLCIPTFSPSFSHSFILPPSFFLVYFLFDLFPSLSPLPYTVSPFPFLLSVGVSLFIPCQLQALFFNRSPN